MQIDATMASGAKLMTQSIQTSVDRTVSDITPNQRHAIEELVGGDLAPDQRIFVLAYRPGVEPNEADKSVARSRIEDFVRSIQQVALVAEVDAAKSLRITRDKDDDPVIETAVRTQADYLCSIDKDIGAKEVVDHCKAVGVEVVTDTALIEILRNQNQE
jgi:hypothetical protein